MRLHYHVLIGTLLLVGQGCNKTAPTPQAPNLLKPATIKDIMDSMVEPSGDFVFESVQEIADEHGITEKAPKTNAEWEGVRRNCRSARGAESVDDGRPQSRAS